MVAVLRLHFGAGVCWEVSDGHSGAWERRRAGDGAPCPAIHGSAPFLNEKPIFSPPAEDGYGLKIQTNFAELGENPSQHRHQTLPCRDNETGNAELETRRKRRV